jgi:ParB family chromosome partitioning protein
MQTIDVTLGEIAGISRFNARHGAPDAAGVEELAASIATAGLQEALILRREDGALNVLDGSRRFAALLLLWERNAPGAIEAPSAFLFEGDDKAAAEYSLATFLHREGLSPVDEFERLCEHAARFGLDAAALAAEFGKPVAWMRDRLRLARLAPPIRAAWRDKRLTLEKARAFAVTDDQAAQEKLLADVGADIATFSPDWIKRQLAGDRLRATDRLAVFVGKADYVAAGGALDEQLFGDEDWFEDGALVRRLAGAKLDAELARVQKEEGWGLGWHELQPGYGALDLDEIDRADYLPDESRRLVEIEDEMLDGEAADDEALSARLEAERCEIDAKAKLRAIGKKERRSLGVVLGVDLQGALAVNRALRPHVKSDPAPKPAAADDSGAETGKKLATSAEKPLKSEPIAAAPKNLLDAAAAHVLTAVLARHPDLALVFAVAALGCSHGVAGLTLPADAPRRGFEPASPLLQSIRHERFEIAFLAVLRARRGDADARIEDDACAVLTAFAELIGGCVDPKGASNFDATRLLLAAATRFGDVAQPLAAALDHDAWFAASGKEAAIAAVEELGGDAKALRKLKAPAAAQAAALLARDRQWLPAPLRLDDFAPKPKEAPPPEPERLKDETPLAQAMAEAIDKDEGATAAFWQKVRDVCRDAAAPSLADWLLENALFGADCEVTPRQLWIAYRDARQASGKNAMKCGWFEKIVADIGFEKQLVNGRNILTGIALASMPRTRVASPQAMADAIDAFAASAQAAKAKKSAPKSKRLKRKETQ